MMAQLENVNLAVIKEESYQHTKIASISSLEGGVRLGWREAFPPTVDGAFEFEKNVRSACPVVDGSWEGDAEPANHFP